MIFNRLIMLVGLVLGSAAILASAALAALMRTLWAAVPLAVLFLVLVAVTFWLRPTKRVPGPQPCRRVEQDPADFYPEAEDTFAALGVDADGDWLEFTTLMAEHPELADLARRDIKPEPRWKRDQPAPWQEGTR